MEKKNMYVEEAEVKKPSRNVPPATYKKIRFNSLGKLDAPVELHFRDYSMIEAQDLAFTNQENNIQVLIDCLNNMVYEDFDCSKLHPNELLEVLYNLQAEFYIPSIRKDYYIDDKLPPEDIENPENITSHDIALKDLIFRVISKEFKEPISVLDPISGSKLVCRLQRIKDVLDLTDYLTNTRFKEEETLYRPILRTLRSEYTKIAREPEEKQEELQNKLEDKIIEVYGKEQLKGANKFHETIVKEMAKIQALTILEFNGKDYRNASIEEKFAILPEISRGMWKRYDDITKDHKFGIEDKVKFYSPKHQKKITRRLLFQYTELLPDFDSSSSERFDVCFG